MAEIETSALASLTAEARSGLAGWPQRYPGLRAIGTLCSYVPDELIHAAGFVPVRVRGRAGPLRRVDAHLQSFTCALCRSTFDQFLGGELSFLAGVVLAHSCDTMQALADMWRMNAGPGYLLDVVMQPARVGPASPAVQAYLLAELGRFRDRLAAWAGRPVTDDDLRASVALYDDTRRLVQAVRQRRDRLSAPEFFAVLDAAQVMPRRVLNPLLVRLAADLEAIPPQPPGARLFLVGAVLDEPTIPALIEDSGARVVGDDLCSGSRHFHGQVGTGPDPLQALVNYYLERPPCPAKYRPGYDPAGALLQQIRQAQAQGVIFVLEKYCDPHAFERGLSLPALDAAGIPHLLLEVEHTPSLEALRTRLQAFVEML